MGVLGGKIGEGVVRYWPPTNSFLLFGVFTPVLILVKIDQEMRPWECSQMDRQKHRQTHTQTQTDFIICPMLYAIAMGQIKNNVSLQCHAITTKLYRTHAATRCYYQNL